MTVYLHWRDDAFDGNERRAAYNTVDEACAQAAHDQDRKGGFELIAVKDEDGNVLEELDGG